MKKSKDTKEPEKFTFEKFHIPQIDYGTFGLIKRKDHFQKSKIASPMHGSHVLDKNHFVDNKGSVDVDYHYDFIRDEKEKHVSEDELIEKHGTKYYEFTFLNDQKGDIYDGTNYHNPKPAQPQTVTNDKKKAFSFIETVDEITNENISITNGTRQTPEEPINYQNQDQEFKINLAIDSEADSYEYNTYDQKMPKPTQTNIPSFLTPKPATSDSTIRDIDSFNVGDNLSFGDTPSLETPKINFNDNPAVNRNQTIENAIKNMTTDFPQKPAQVQENQSSAESFISKPISNKYENYQIPYQSLFKHSLNTVDEHPAWLEEKKEIINQLLASFGIDGEVVTYTKGPTFTRYEILLAAGVNVKKINTIIDNLQKDLQAKSLRVQAPIPGKNTIGIEVPNDKADVVAFGDIIDDSFVNNKKQLLVAMGKDIDGQGIYENISDMPHALIAGATQSGKSVSINTILVSLLIKNSPDSLKLILVDPKRVELSFYNDLPHLASPVIDDPFMATEALKWCVSEMERRYDVLSRYRVRNIGDYNTKRQGYPEMEKMPFIVVVVDEFNELVMQCGADVNDCITRLAQKARAAGIHIILATQRPTTDVVTGIIKANIPCRIAFKVAAEVDSRIILDESGAENLLGRGDMIIKGNQAPIRAQGAYISDDEINNICDYIRSRYEPDYLFTHDDLKRELARAQGVTNFNSKDAAVEDEATLYHIALSCLQTGTCSINSIQNGFNVGFNRAQRIVSILEERQIVSRKNGTKSREFLVTEQELKQMFNIKDE